MTSLNDIAGIVNLSEGVSYAETNLLGTVTEVLHLIQSEIQITVLRPRFRSPSDSNNESNRGEPDEEEINLILIPRTGWGGRGMLGYVHVASNLSWRLTAIWGMLGSDVIYFLFDFG